MRDSDKDGVRNLGLFSSMQEASFEDLLHGSFFQRFPPHVVLVHEGEPADFLHVLVAGSAELYGEWNGQECTIDVARPISTFILAAVIKDAPYLMSARTLESSNILMIPSANLLAAMRVDSEFAIAMVTELARCYRGVVKSLKNVKLRSAVERLANYLLRLREEQGGSGAVVLPFEKRLIASELGMSAENLSRAFNTLKPYGVAVQGSEIELSKIEDLKKLAIPSRLIDDLDS